MAGETGVAEEADAGLAVHGRLAVTRSVTRRSKHAEMAGRGSRELRGAGQVRHDGNIALNDISLE